MAEETEMAEDMKSLAEADGMQRIEVTLDDFKVTDDRIKMTVEFGFPKDQLTESEILALRGLNVERLMKMFMKMTEEEGDAG